MAVYLIKSGEYIKIGYSETPQARIGNLQTATPNELKLIAVIPGDTGLEAYLHTRFAEFRVRGEWFINAGILAEFVENAKTTFPVPEQATRPERTSAAVPSAQPPAKEYQKNPGRLKYDQAPVMSDTLNVYLQRLIDSGRYVMIAEEEGGVRLRIEGARYNDGKPSFFVSRITKIARERKAHEDDERLEAVFIPLSIYVSRMGGKCSLRNDGDHLMIYIERATLANGQIELAEMDEA